MNNGKLVSRVINTAKAYTKDEHLSRRWILDIARTQANQLMAQKLGEMSLNREDNVVSELKCFEMKSLDVVSCNIVEFKRCGILMESKLDLPEMVYSRLGHSVFLVTTLDGVEIPVLPFSSASLQKDRYVKNTKPRAYVLNNKLYITEQRVEAVNVLMVAIDAKEVLDKSGCEDCPECQSLWDFEFIVPSKLENVVVAQTLNEVLTSKGIPIDENPNFDSNQKTQTTP
jgi:hypothetical protein